MARDLDEDNGVGDAPAEIDDEQFLKDVQAVVRGREKVSKANADHGATLKSLEDQRGYNKKAFNLICELAKKSNDGVADFLRTFNAGVRALKLGTPEQADLFEGSGADPNEGKAGEKVASLAKERTKRNGKAKAREKDGEPVH